MSRLLLPLPAESFLSKSQIFVDLFLSFDTLSSLLHQIVSVKDFPFDLSMRMVLDLLGHFHHLLLGQPLTLKLSQLLPDDGLRNLSLVSEDVVQFRGVHYLVVLLVFQNSFHLFLLLLELNERHSLVVVNTVLLLFALWVVLLFRFSCFRNSQGSVQVLLLEGQCFLEGGPLGELDIAEPFAFEGDLVSYYTHIIDLSTF